jgi:hypothetical protein
MARFDLIRAATHNDEPSSHLRNAIVSGVQHFRNDNVALGFKLGYELVEDCRMPSGCHSWNVLHHEIPGAERRHESEKVKYKAVARIVD